MANQIETTKNQSESTVNLFRRFTRKVKNAGFIQTVKDGRYFERSRSLLKKKARKMNGLKKAEERRDAIKMGTITERDRK